MMYSCVFPRANHLLRQIPPALARHSAEQHDYVTARGLAALLQVDALDDTTWRQCRLPIRLSGLGLRNSVRTSPAAYWASWADSLPTLHRRFPLFAARVGGALMADPGDGSQLDDIPCLAELSRARQTLLRDCPALPTWAEVIGGATPTELMEDADEIMPGEWSGGWQYVASNKLEKSEHAALLRGSRADATRIRSCGGPHSGQWLTTAPSSDRLALRCPVMQILLRRRLGLVVDPVSTSCEAPRCGAQLDGKGHHRSACTRTGRIHGRHAAAVGPWQQVLSEASYRTHTERLLRNTHLAVRPADQRRMDLVAAPGARGIGARRGLSLFCDITIVSPLTRNGVSRNGARHTDGAMVAAAARRKHAHYADIDASGIAAFIVLGSEVFGRWGAEALKLVSDLAALKARSAPPLLRQSARAAWTSRWWGILSIGTQRAIGEALLCPNGADLIAGTTLADPPPITDIITDMM